MGCGASLPTPEAFLVPVDGLRCLQAPTTALEVIRVAPQFRLFTLPVMHTSPDGSRHQFGADATVKASDSASILTTIEMRLINQRQNQRYVDIKDGDGALRARMFGTHASALIYSAAPAYEGQQPSAKTKDGTFAWAKMLKRATSLRDHYTVHAATGQDEYETKGSFEARGPSVGTTSMAVTYKGGGCCLIEYKAFHDEGQLAGTHGYAITFARGMDALLMIALVAVRDGALGPPVPASSGGGGG